MAVGASQPTVVGTKDGRIGIKNQMQVNYLYHLNFQRYTFSPIDLVLAICLLII